MPIPKEGSRKRQVYDVLKKDGHDAAVKLGEKLGLSNSTVKSWLGTWSKGPAVASATTAQAVGFDANYQYDTEDQARSAISRLARMYNIDPECYAPVTNEKGKWAFVPIHVQHQFGLPKAGGTFRKEDLVVPP
jgi:hypothetical protein